MTSASGQAAAASGAPGASLWLDTLHMSTATSGWALRWTGNPTGTAAVHLAPTRTTDGGRTWTDVTPPTAGPMLDTPDAAAVLDPLSAETAILAVTAATTQDGTAGTSEVFVTGDGGRTWSESAPLKAAGSVSLLSFADAEDGWLLMDDVGPATGSTVPLYRTSDGGLQWSSIAGSAPSGAGGGAAPGQCQTTGLSFATASTGWLTGTCGLLTSDDAGATWTTQSLPLPAGQCQGVGCSEFGPQFEGDTGFVTVDRANGTPYFLISRDLGRTWQHVALPAGSGVYPQLTFFSAEQGVLVAAGSQDALGAVFSTTTDGGLTWTAVPQGHAFTELGAAVDFVSPQTGFAWTEGTDATGAAPAMDETTDSGRTWKAFTPRLVANS